MIQRFISSPAEVTPKLQFHFQCDLHLNLTVSVIISDTVFLNSSENFHQNVRDVAAESLCLTLFIKLKIHCLRENYMFEA